MAIAYQSNRPALSVVDAFALALADRQGWHLLTEDRTMRSVVQSKGIAHRDALWVIDSMLDVGILSASYRRPRSSWHLKPCGTTRDVPFPNLS